MTTDMRMQRVRNFLKERMKQQGRSYEDLAAHLNMSLSTVKRFMTREEISTERLLSICDWLDVKISDVFLAAEKTPAEKRALFTEEQEEFLALDDLHYRIFVRIAEGHTAGKISQSLSVDEDTVTRTLWELERLKLIRTARDGRTYRAGKYGEVRAGGPLFKKYIDRVHTATRKNILKRISRSAPDSSLDNVLQAERVFMAAVLLAMQRNTWTKYHRKFEDLFLEFSQAASSDAKTCPPEELITVITYAMIDHSAAPEKDYAELFSDAIAPR